MLHNSRENQINNAQITILQLLLTNQIKRWFLMRGENRSPRGKTLLGRLENQQTQSTYFTRSAEIEPRPHWWKASALTTRPTLLNYHCEIITILTFRELLLCQRVTTISQL